MNAHPDAMSTQVPHTPIIKPKPPPPPTKSNRRINGTLSRVPNPNPQIGVKMIPVTNLSSGLNFSAPENNERKNTALRNPHMISPPRSDHRSLIVYEDLELVRVELQLAPRTKNPSATYPTFLGSVANPVCDD